MQTDLPIPEHDSPAVMIDQAFGYIEDWLDRCLVAQAEVEGIANIHEILGRLSLMEKIHLLLDEGIDALENEFYSRDMWSEVRDLTALRPELDGSEDHERVRKWLDEQGWSAPEVGIEAPEPLRTEIVLRISLNGLLIYLEGWFSETP